MPETVETVWRAWQELPPVVIVGSCVALVVLMAVCVWKFGHAVNASTSDMPADNWLGENGIRPRRW